MTTPSQSDQEAITAYVNGYTSSLPSGWTPLLDENGDPKTMEIDATEQVFRSLNPAWR